MLFIIATINVHFIGAM